MSEESEGVSSGPEHISAGEKDKAGSHFASYAAPDPVSSEKSERTAPSMTDMVEAVSSPQSPVSASPQYAEQPSAPEDSPMEIHKPKPVHNWSEFLKEYAIIVLGVATALAAEQGVEWLHWHNQVIEARAALADELAETVDNSIARLKAYDCVEKRLDFVASTLDRASVTRMLPPIPAISAPPSGALPSGVWGTVVASQTATHFSRSELSALGSFYATAQILSDHNTSELQHWESLNSMVGPGRPFDPASEAEMRKALSSARTENFLITLISGQIIVGINALHLPFSMDSKREMENLSRQPSNREICKPMPTGAPAFYGQSVGGSRVPEIRDYQQHLPQMTF